MTCSICDDTGMAPVTGNGGDGYEKCKCQDELVDRAVKALQRWVASDFYCYIRPISARYFDPEAEADDIVWIVQCEYRNISPVQVKEHGKVLDEVICRVDVQMPIREPGYVIERPTMGGWLCPYPPGSPLQRVVVTRKAVPRGTAARHARIVARRRRR